MNRLACLCLVAVWSVAGPAFAADPPGDEEEQPQTIKLTLHPAAEPRPALKYVLLPPVTDRVPGNAAVVYPKSRMERGSVALKTIADAVEKCGDWLDLPADKLPWDEVRREIDTGTVRSQTRYADEGARRERYEYDLPLHNGFGVMYLLPHVNLFRELARLTAMQARLQIADGKYDEAAHSLQTVFSMARQVAEEPALVCGLVGMAIEQIAAIPVEDWISRPDSPSLYWALSALPRPFINLHPAWDVEYSLIDLSYPQLKELETRPFSVEEMRALAKNWARDMRLLGGGDSSGLGHGAEFDARLAALAIKAYPIAKRYLIAHGRPAKDVEAMPVLQVVVLHTLAVYNEMLDEQFRWLYMPYAESVEYLRREEQRFAAEPDREIIPLAQINLLALRMVFAASARTDRRIAALRLIEALRLYAYDHDGRLPAKLSEITAVPMPIDPVTGKPFEYAQTDDTAVITSPPVRENDPTSGLRYELKMLPK